ncbi:unnamed protein product [Diatraea saccharalis]|nr:unnamed protein product [Diatraea saccharalis]
METTETNATLEDLFPGAVYEIGVAAVSHGLSSEWHTLYKPVRPLPPKWLRVERASSNSLRARWEGPGKGALGSFQLQYRADSTPHPQSAWVSLPPLPASSTSEELPNLSPGERYQVRLDTASEPATGDAVTSGHPLDVYHVVRPSPVSNVGQLVDTRNMTLEWPRPAGRVEFYSLRWWRADGSEGAGAQGARNVTAEGGGRLARALLSGLSPGAPYTVTIAAHSYDLVSDLFTMDTRTRPLIQSEMTIVTESGTDEADNDTESDTSPASLKVLYTRTPESASTFDSYRFRLEGEGEGAEGARVVDRPASAAPQQVLFTRLVPGRLYNVTMWTVSRNVTSHPVARQARLFPRPVPWLNATWVGARGVGLGWGAPAGDATDYELQYLADAHTLRTNHTSARAFNVTGLRPHTNYTFTVVVRAGTRDTLLALSRAHSAEVTTLEAAPEAPADFRVIDATPNSLTFAWEMPMESRHGELRKFVLTYAPTDSSGPGDRLELGPAARTATAAGLAAGASYRAQLIAETGAGAGPPATLTQSAPIAAPPPPPPAATPRALRQTPTTVAVRFRSDAFSHANGNVTAYTLVLAEEPRADTPPRLPSWRDVHRLPVWPPYQVRPSLSLIRP